MPSPPTRRLRLACLAILLAPLAPASAHADATVTELARDTPIAAYGGALAWSAYDAAAQRYRLMIRRGGETVAARAPGALRAFDISLGPDSRGRVVALYTRCRVTARGRDPERGCDVYRYDLRARTERKLASVSSPSFDEVWPAQWRGRIAFARRARTRVVSGFDHRPAARGSGPVIDCDVPYIKTLSSRAPSRRLDRSQCGATAGIAIRDATIVHVAGVSLGGAGSESQVRLLRAGGGSARRLARAGGGEGGYSPFGSPNLSSSSVFLTRTGQRQGVAQGFLRIDLRTGRLTTVAANLNLAGVFARDERGRFWYVQGPEPEVSDHGDPPYCRSAIDPCRLVRASASPFSSTTRALLPRLSVDGAAGQYLVAFAADPPRLTGDLTRAIVRAGAVTRREPLPGVALDLLRIEDENVPTPVAPTGLTTTTDATGRWSFTLNDPPPLIALVVFAPALKVASAGIGVRADARIALAASGRTLTGSVAPGQPGRTVEIQRLSVDAQGRRPGGPQVCTLPVNPQTCADDAWTTVVQAPLDAAGRAFSATVADAGEYRARLPYAADSQGRPTAYGGVSAAVGVP